MTSLRTAKDEPSAGDRIPAIGSTIPVHVAELKKWFAAVDLLTFRDRYSNVTDPDVRTADCQAVSPGVEQKTTAAVQPRPVGQASSDNYNY